jgi:GNAT superfamily N-acetyltransferase
MSSTIRPARADEMGAILGIINRAAQAYRGAIPADCFHEPYMSEAGLSDELAAGVTFVAYDIEGVIAGVMGIQRVDDVDLIRHAYVAPEYQGRGIGGALLTYLRMRSTGRILIGTWRAATWAIRFYEGHGFQLVPAESTAQLLRTYWSVSWRQIDESVVLAAPALDPPPAGV